MQYVWISWSTIILTLWFVFGAYWSGLFEHLYWQKSEKVNPETYSYG